jgi:hypothetical protein
MAFDPTFTGGVYVAVGDVNGDGYGDIIVSADTGGGPRVNIFSGKDLSLLDSFFAYDPAFGGGVRVAVARDNNGAVDLITGAGPGGGPHLKVFRVSDLSMIQSYFAFDPNFRGGISVGAGDVLGTGKMQVIVGAGAGGGPQVNVFSLTDSSTLASLYAFAAGFSGGVCVGAMDVGNDGTKGLVVAAGAGGGPHVRVLNMSDHTEMESFFAFDPAFLGGVFVGGS